MARSVEEFETDPETTEAERELIAACREGKPCKLNGGKLPAEGAEGPKVRAALIRLLAVEATSLHEKGVWLRGATISGELDLSFAKCRGGFVLHNCRFAKAPQLAQAELAQLSLDGCLLPGLSAQGIKITGSLILRRVNSTGPVEVSGAQIGGQFACGRATLYGGEGEALNAQGLKVMDDLFLRYTKVTGTVNVSGAQIGGQISFANASLNGGKSGALVCQFLRAGETFYFQKIKELSGLVDLTAAHVGVLADDVDTWKRSDHIILDGFTYDQILGEDSPKTFGKRKAWLENGSRIKIEKDSHIEYQFSPQPYTQFASVMRAAGHLAEARATLVERDRILYAEAEKADRAALAEAWGGDQSKRADCGKIWLRLHGRRLWAGLTRRVVGYGHKPEKALNYTFRFWLLGTVIYFAGWRAGLMVPNAETGLPPAAFVSAIYALDLFMPVMDFGQERAWVASGHGFWGAVLQLGSFLYQIAGWVVVSLGLAAVTGFVQRNGPE